MVYDPARMTTISFAIGLLLAPTFAPACPSGPSSQDGQSGIPAAQAADLARTEAVASFVGAVFGRLDESFRETGDPLSEETASEIIGDDGLGAKRPASREPLREARGAFEVRDFAEIALELEEGTGPTDTADDLRDAFRALEDELGGRPTRGVEFAIKKVTPVAVHANQFEVRARVRAVRLVEGAPSREVFARWTSRWRVDGDDRELIAISPSIIRTAGTAGAGFVDVTESVLTDPKVALLGPSVMDLRRNLDAAIDVGILGHHGVTVADVNGDGIDDLYLCQPGGIPNQLWIRAADGTATEVAAAGGLDFLDATTSALFVDLDGDGDRDVALSLASGVRVLARTPSAYVETARFDRNSVTGLSAADVDGDGLLDLYVCAYANPYEGGVFPEPYHDAENGQANVLLVNRTEKRDEISFADETAERGLADGATRFSFAATFEDIEADGDIDLYVANDFGRNALYVNDGTGHFVDRADDAGVVDVAAGMGAAFADFDRDGHVDLYVSNMESSAGRRVTAGDGFRPDVDGVSRALLRRHAKGNTLYLGRGDGTFVETDAAEAGRWAWGGLPLDIDADGALDIFVPNGFVTGAKPDAPDL